MSNDATKLAQEAGFSVYDGIVMGGNLDLERFHTLARNATLDEIAGKIALMPFGDTAASFAVWIKEQKT
jgi:phosphotransferase system  glucose/maltose/N-acetylglucosamine-specific IIC component